MTLGDVIREMRAVGCTEKQIAGVTVALAALKPTSNAVRQAEFRKRQKAANLGATAVTVTHTVTSRKPFPEVAPQENINSTPHPTPYPKLSRARPRTVIDPEAQPSERNLSDATKLGLDANLVREQWPKFVNYHAAKGSLMADWEAAWRTWCGNVSQYQPRQINGHRYQRSLAEENADFIRSQRSRRGTHGQESDDLFAGPTIDGVVEDVSRSTIDPSKCH